MLGKIIFFAAIFAICWGAISYNAPEMSKEQQIKSKSVDNKRHDEQSFSKQFYKTDESNCRNCEPEKDWWIKLWTDPVATFTGLLAFVTAGLIYVGVRQEFHLRDTAKRELRAYVGVKSAFIRLTGAATTSKKILGKVTITNSGQTTAYKARLAIHIGFFNTTNGTFPIDHRPGSTYLHPQFEWTAEQETDIDVSDTLRDDLLNKRRYVILWGAVSYMDTFGVERVSTFRFRQGMFVIADNLTGWNVYPCEEGNETDEDKRLPS